MRSNRLIGYASCSPQSAQACEPAAYSSWTSAHAPMPVEGADELVVVETGKVPREPQGLQATQSRHVAQVLYLLILDGAFARSRRRRGASSARFIELARTSSEPPLSPVMDCMRDVGMRWDADGVELADASTHIPKDRAAFRGLSKRNVLHSQGCGRWRGSAGCSSHRRGTVACAWSAAPRRGAYARPSRETRLGLHPLLPGPCGGLHARQWHSSERV